MLGKRALATVAALLVAGALAGCEVQHAAVDRVDILADSPGGLTVGDFNDDGKDEVLVGSQTRYYGMYLVAEDDRGRFQLQPLINPVKHTDQLLTIQANSDGVPDALATPDGDPDDDGMVTLLESLGDGTFRAHEYPPGNLFGIPGSLYMKGVTAAAEVRATGSWGGVQLVALGTTWKYPSEAETGAVSVWRVQNNQLVNRVDLQVGGGSSDARVTALTFGDLTQDGRPDLVVGRADGEVTVYEGDQQAATFKAGQVLWHDQSIIKGPITSLAVGDVGVQETPGGLPPGLEADGRPDILAVHNGGTQADVLATYMNASNELRLLTIRPILSWMSGGWTELSRIMAEPGGTTRWLAAGNKVSQGVAEPHVYWGNRSGNDWVKLPGPCELQDAQPIRTGVPGSPHGVAYTCRNSRSVMVWMPGRLRIQAPEQVDLGAAQVNQGSAVRDIIISASSHFRLEDAWIGGADASEFTLQAEPGNCTFSCQLRVTFTPRSAGAKSARLTVQTDGYPRVIQIPLEATATAPQLVAPSELQLGGVKVGQTKSAQLSLRNDGDAPLQITALALQGADASAFQVESGSCQGTLGAGQSCNASVSVTPGARGPLSARLRVQTDPTEYATEIELSATGTSAELTAPSQLQLGAVRVGETKSTQLTLRNDGNEPLLIVGFQVQGADAGAFQVDAGGCMGSLGAGQSCNASVSVAPGARGQLSASLRVVTDPAEHSTEIALSATGTNAQLAAPSQLGFGPVRVGESKGRQLTLRNDGDAPMLISALELEGANAGAFQVDAGGCTGTLGAGQSCNASVSVKPRARGPLSASLRIVTDPAEHSAVVALSAKGATPQLSLATKAPRSARVLSPGAKAKPIRVVIRNRGDASARRVELHLRLPSGVRLKSPKGRKRGRAIVHALGELAPGARKVVRLKLVGRDPAGGGKLRIKLLSADLPKPRSSSIRLRVR